jgi:hypothetical protein
LLITPPCNEPIGHERARAHRRAQMIPKDSPRKNILCRLHRGQHLGLAKQQRSLYRWADSASVRTTQQNAVVVFACIPHSGELAPKLQRGTQLLFAVRSASVSSNRLDCYNGQPAGIR